MAFRGEAASGLSKGGRPTSSLATKTGVGSAKAAACGSLYEGRRGNLFSRFLKMKVVDTEAQLVVVVIVEAVNIMVVGTTLDDDE